MLLSLTHFKLIPCDLLRYVLHKLNRTGDRQAGVSDNRGNDEYINLSDLADQLGKWSGPHISGAVMSLFTTHEISHPYDSAA